MLKPLLIMLTIVLADNVAFAQSGEVAIVKKWALAQKEVATVHTEFLQYRYETVFKTCQVIKGEVIFSSPASGFISYAPWSEKEAATTVTRAGEKYEIKPSSEVSFIWSEGNLSIADVQKKEYQKISLNKTSFFSWTKLSSITSAIPFLPGMPDKKVFSQWSFELVSENENEIRLSATPPKELKNQFKSCDLILHKPEMNLYAVRHNHSGSNYTTVIIFTSAKHNPKELPAFDLSGFRKISPIPEDSAKNNSPLNGPATYSVEEQMRIFVLFIAQLTQLLLPCFSPFY